MNSDSFFDYEKFMPHGMCYLWQPDILWTSVASDIVTALSYYSITLAFIYFVNKRTDLPYPWFFVLAGSIIFMACGTTHLISAIVIWEPIYGISAISKAITATSSFFTGILIWFILPFFLGLASPSMLKKKNEALSISLNKLKSAQKHIIESEKLASLGNLVGGIAHELNTPIGIGITSASYLQERIEWGKKTKLTPQDSTQLFDELSDGIELIYKNLNQTANLVEVFKNIAVNQKRDDDFCFDLKDYLVDLISVLSSKLKLTPSNIEFNCPPDIMITANPSSIIHILTNLMENSAIHAFTNPAQGLIELNIMLDADGSLLIKYSDNGLGMDEEQVEKVFNPFYTTKRVEGHTGLGMTILYNTVSHLKGELVCKSILDQGTSFTIHLPANLITRAHENKQEPIIQAPSI
ncbi:MAG: HAMP domain-containing histidine kinase [Oleispira sp.]|nr:HAMP domain-containing histidine kinase [Oleispira sp.]MBL4881010.1 HAMP domain-containing histidine kinase [Oleispira sp.]